MRIAYIISAYRYPLQLERLVRRLDTGAVRFFVHVDKKAEDRLFRPVIDLLGGLPNVHFLRRHNCEWGSFGHVEATIKGIVALLDSKFAFDYAILLTGQDYPIKPNSYIAEALGQSEGKIYMEYFALPHGGWKRGGMDRIEYRHFHSLAWLCRFLAGRSYDVQVGRPRLSSLLAISRIRRRFPEGFGPFGGSSYWCLPRACIEYLSEFVEHNRSFVDFFRHVDIPDEIFFQTLVLNSPLKGKVVNDDLRYVDWRDENSGSPAILRTDDFEAIRASSKLFARKFDVTEDAEILDMIDRQILAVQPYER